MPTPESHPHAHIPKGARIILVRHGQPALPLRPRTSHHEFRDYIDAYEAAGLDPESLPPSRNNHCLSSGGALLGGLRMWTSCSKL